jgi:hypothetical protein
VEVTLPDGTRIRASSIVDRVEDDPARDFGLYLDARWEPTWPSDTIDWQDFGLPADGTRAATQIRDAFLRARRGQTVEVGCLGGLGRTGTVLACMAVLAGLEAFRCELGQAELQIGSRRNRRSGAMGRLVQRMGPEYRVPYGSGVTANAVLADT